MGYPAGPFGDIAVSAAPPPGAPRRRRPTDAPAPAPSAPVPPVAPAPVDRTPALDAAALVDEIQNLSSEDFASLMAGAAASRRLRSGDKVKGRVVRVTRDAIFCDVGAKSEAMLPRTESDAEIAVGDVIHATVLSSDDRGLRVGRHLSGGGEEQLEDAYNSGVSVEGRVESRNTGGFVVRVGGARAFCPLSHMDRTLVEDLDSYVGQSFAFKVLQFGAGDAVVSRRALAEAEAEKRAAATWETLTEGDMREALVVAHHAAGAFVEVDGVRGLIPRREAGWGHDAALPAIGSRVQARVTRADRDTRKLSLSLKDPGSTPWSRVGLDFVEGGAYTGRVTRLTEFGAFINLAPGLEGLLHISRILDKKAPKGQSIEDVMKVGDDLRVRIVSVEIERERLQLAVVRPGEPEEAPEPRPTLPRDTGKLGTLADIFGKVKVQR